jgi:hypothetical protein
MKKLMTEDDTYNALRRVPLIDAMKIYHRFWNKKSLHDELRKTGWTLEDLRVHYREANKKDLS